MASCRGTPRPGHPLRDLPSLGARPVVTRAWSGTGGRPGDCTSRRCPPDHLRKKLITCHDLGAELGNPPWCSSHREAESPAQVQRGRGPQPGARPARRCAADLRKLIGDLAAVPPCSLPMRPASQRGGARENSVRECRRTVTEVRGLQLGCGPLRGGARVQSHSPPAAVTKESCLQPSC